MIQLFWGWQTHTQERANPARPNIYFYYERFVVGATARAALGLAKLVGVNRNMTNRFYLILSQIVGK